MPFTSQELGNIATSVLDKHIDRGKIYTSTVQNKPLLKALNQRAKSFSASKEFLKIRVKGEYDTTIEGWTADESVSYGNPANIKEATFEYKRIHAGIKVTHDELMRNGITVNEDGSGTSVKSDREMEMLADLMQDKLEDMEEGRARGMNNMFWRDGSQDSSLVAGIKSFILTDPTSATIVGGIDQSTNSWWRNYAKLGINAATPSNLNVATELQIMQRQLVRYGNPNIMYFAGSDFIEALEAELRANGTYTDNGFAGGKDVSVGGIKFKGRDIVYDPTLDDEGESKYCYALDMNAICAYYMKSERGRVHSPHRPAEKYVMYRAKTDVLGLTINQRNTSGVLTIA